MPSGRTYSANSLIELQRSFATARNPVESWPKSFYHSFYSKTSWPGVTFHFLRSPEHIKQVLVDHAYAFERAPLHQELLRPLLGNGLITAEGESWRQQRAIASPAFRAVALSSLVPQVVMAAEGAAERLQRSVGDEPVLMMPVMVDAALSVITALMVGNRETPFDAQRIADALSVYLEEIGNPNDPKTRHAVETVAAISEHLIDHASTSDPDSSTLLGRLLGGAGSDCDAVTLSDAKDNIATFVLAGHETTAAGMTWALYLLAENPEIQDSVFEEIDEAVGAGSLDADLVRRLPLLKRVVMETLRLFPPVANLSRVARHDVTVDTIPFKAGDVAEILIHPMHRHALIWEEPDRFDPNRFLGEPSAARHKFAYLPFGAGPRICIGSTLAYLELSLMIAAVVRKCRLALTTGYRPRPRVRLSLRPHDGLPLLVSRR